MNKSFLFFTIIFSFILCCCSSIKQPKEVYNIPDFTEEDAVRSEIRKIEKISKEKPVMALWLSYLLNDEETLKKNEQEVCSLTQKSSEEKKYLDAIRLYESLFLVSKQAALGSGVKKENLYAEFQKNLPTAKKDSSHIVKTIQDCVNATVTIWVDRGITIHNGVGYADRVLGSGFFIDMRGYLITNHHVISDLVDPKYEGYSRLYIKLADDQDTRIPAKVIGFDPILDLALLKVEVDPLFLFELGSSSQLHIGDKVSAIGTPLGLHGTLTSGIVSSVDRKLFTTGSVFQIDTPVNSGNSGGPLIDESKKVQAVVFAGIQQYQGLNFAIPVEYVRQDLPYLFNGGKRHHVWVGAYGHTFKENNRNAGLELQYVMPGGSAFRVGMKKGDVITFVAGKRVYSLEDVQDIFRNYSSESIIQCSYVRDGQTYNCLLYLDERPQNPGYEMYCSDLLSHSLVPILGMELTPSSTLSSRKYTISDIIRGSVADESGFSVTDPVYITSVDFYEDFSAMSVQMNTRKRKKGYLDITMRLGSQLDSPYYF